MSFSDPVDVAVHTLLLELESNRIHMTEFIPGFTVAVWDSELSPFTQQVQEVLNLWIDPKWRRDKLIIVLLQEELRMLGLAHTRLLRRLEEADAEIQRLNIT